MRWTEDLVGEVRRLIVDEGMSASRAASALGDRFSRVAIIGICSRRGIPLNAHPDGRKARATPRPIERRNIHPGNIVRKAASRQFDPKPPIVREAPPDIADMPLVAVWELKTAHCRWPVGEPSDIEEFRYCGRSRAGEGPYCAGHHALAYRPRGVSDDARAA